jgi:hypothetical protein
MFDSLPSAQLFLAVFVNLIVPTGLFVGIS